MRYCKGYKRYKGQVAPRCNSGKPCQACVLRFKLKLK